MQINLKKNSKANSPQLNIGEKILTYDNKSNNEFNSVMSTSYNNGGGMAY